MNRTLVLKRPSALERTLMREQTLVLERTRLLNTDDRRPQPRANGPR